MATAPKPRAGRPARPPGQILKKRRRGELAMNTSPVLWLQAYIIGVLVLISIAAITEHPEWFN
jgi:hypothetical protein